MSATYDLFTKWKGKRGFTSDNQGALELGLTRASVSAWKNERNAEAHVIAVMAKEIGEDPGVWLARVQAEKTTNAEDRKEWLRLAARLATAAAIVMTLGITRVQAEPAKPLQGAVFSSPVYTLCAI